MAKARGRPCPGAQHPDAEADDRDGVHGGERPDDASFEREDAPLGADGADSDGDAAGLPVEPELMYDASSAARLSDDQLFDVVHRFEDAETHRKSGHS